MSEYFNGMAVLSVPRGPAAGFFTGPWKESAMEVRMCSKCGAAIQPQRLVALPNTQCCVGCSCEKCKTVLDVEVDGPAEDELRQSVTGVERE